MRKHTSAMETTKTSTKEQLSAWNGSLCWGSFGIQFGDDLVDLDGQRYRVFHITKYQKQLVTHPVIKTDFYT